jgi:acetolactate synthase-1/2/3 large subunit
LKQDNFDTGAKFIAETLKGYGVTHLFYLEAILREAMVELEKRGIKRVLTHSEKAAAYMACGYGRISGRPGICLAQSVGAFNLASGLQEGYLASAPVIAVSGKKTPLFQNRQCYQEVSHDFFKPVTKYNADVTDAEQLPNVLRQAFREATTGVPKPVHIDVSDHMGRIIDKQQMHQKVMVETQFEKILSFRPEPNTADLEKASQIIEKAERPVILAGGGAVVSGAASEITVLAENNSIPVVNSVDGKGSILETHPLCIGTCGTYSRSCANKTLHEADLIVAIGCRISDQVTHDWALISSDTKIVQIDIDPSVLGLNYPNEVSIWGDAKAALKLLNKHLSFHKPTSKWAKKTQGYLAEWRKELELKFSSDDVPIRPERLCIEISRGLPDNGVLVSDTGNSAIWTSTMCELTKPQQTYMRPTGGALGWGFPGAMGVKCAVPERPVICFTGDGGFLYHLCELETAARLGINTITIVNNNQGLGQCKPNIYKLYGNRTGNKKDMYWFRPLNFARIAEEMGCLGIRVEKPEDIQPALDQALKTDDRPVVLDVVTNVDCSTPPVYSPAT